MAAITPVTGGFSVNSVMVLDMVVLEKPSSSAVLVTEAPAIRAPTIRPFNSVRSRILDKYTYLQWIQTPIMKFGSIFLI